MNSAVARGLCRLLAAGWLLAAAAAWAAPPAAAGRIDLRGWDPQRDGIAALDGAWAFSWSQMEDPAAPPPPPAGFLEVPRPWNLQGYPSKGHGSYRLRIDCDRAEGLALSLPFQHSAVAWWANGVPVTAQGRPAPDRSQHTPSMEQKIVALPRGAACPLDLVAHVANHDVFRGGLVRSVQLGEERQLLQRRESALMRATLALGAVLVVALLSLIFYSWRRRDRTPLYFGLYCLSFGLSLGLSGERPLQGLADGLAFEAQLRLLFVNWFAGLCMYPLMLQSLYPREVHPRAVRAIVWFSVAGSALPLFTPVHVFTLATPALQGGSALTIAYVAFVLMLAVRRRRAGAATLLVGLVLLAASMVHDVVFFQHLLAISLLPYGVLGVVVAPAILLARRFAQALAAEESRLIAQRSRTDLLVRATKAGLLDWDTVQDRIAYSERYKEMLGFGDVPDASLPGLRELLHPQERDAVYGHFLAQLKARDLKDGLRQYLPQDFRMRRADGQYIWVHAEATGVCGADGRTLRFICSLIDITDSHRHGLEMENRAKFINDLFDSVPLGLALRDAQGRYLVVNRTWERYLGLSRDSVVGTALGDLDDPFARETLERDRQALQLGPDAQGVAHEYDYQGRRYLQTRTVMVDAQGVRIGVLAASLDITEKHQAEQALATERERLRLLVRSSRAGFGDWDAQGDRVSYDERFKEMLGYPADFDTAGWPSIFEMMHPDDREGARERFRAMIRRRGGAPEQWPGEAMSYRLRRRDGRYIWVHAEGISQVDAQGRTRRFITSYMDVTAFREQQDQLRESHDRIAAQAAQLELQNEALKENVRLREEVERIGRHDLKTPLNSIVAVPRLLREERRLGPEADELLGIVERAGYRILSMVNLSLDLYKIEQGSYVFRPDAVDLADLASKVVADVRMHAASKQVRVAVDVDRAPYAWAEELLCYSLLANLLKNAVEASPEGGVVRLSAQACDAGVQIAIHNAGEVPAVLRANFFGKYATLGKASGTGLGTYSARLMARVQDGDIRMTTGEAGTTLTIVLRAAPAGAVPATVRHVAERSGSSPDAVAALPPMRVLLVDDDEYNLLIVRRFLPSPPFTVDTAINGKVALAAAELQWPDVVFMDLDMPVMGGLQAAREFRALERATLARRCTLVALSSHDDEETRRVSLAAGFDRYLTKPVTRELVHETLLELHTLIGGGPGGAPPPIATRAPAVPRMQDPVVADPDVEPVLAEFLKSRRQLVADMARAMQAGDRGEVRRISHQLAGSFGLYGFLWASEQSRWIEKNFSEVEDDELGRIAAELGRHLDTVQVRFGPSP